MNEARKLMAKHDASRKNTRVQPGPMGGRGIYICSAYRPTSEDETQRKAELAKNVGRAIDASHFVAKLGFVPFAPHIYATQFLRDEVEDERKIGMEIGDAWLSVCSELWVWGYDGPDSITKGMRHEIRWAKTHGLTIHCFPEPIELMEMIDAEMKGDTTKRFKDVMKKILEGSLYIGGMKPWWDGEGKSADKGGDPDEP